MIPSHKLALRALAVGAAFSAALSANAWIIQIDGTIDNMNVVTGTTYKFSDLPQLNNTFGYVFGVNGLGALTATVFNGGSSLSLVNIPGTEKSHFNNGTFSYSGEWTSTAIVNLPVAKTGTYSGIFDTPGGNFSLQIAGNVVPEPASMVALGLGAALIRRRRRS